MKKVIKLLPAMAIILGSGLAVATTQKHVAGSWGQVPTTVDPSGWVNIHSLPDGYSDYDCIRSEETCLYNSQNENDPGTDKGTFVLIPDED